MGPGAVRGAVARQVSQMRPLPRGLGASCCCICSIRSPHTMLRTPRSSDGEERSPRLYSLLLMCISIVFPAF